MFIINRELNNIDKVEQKSFSELEFSERYHLQVWIEKNPSCLGEDLLFIQKEFDKFDDTRERLDLLALDKNGNLVIIENKLDDSGRNVTWQALKYASYCSTLSKNQIKEIYQNYLNKNNQDENAEENILEFLEKSYFDEVQLNKVQRIILVANHYRKEVTSTVLWLMNEYNMPIKCFKATPYQYQDILFLDMEQIIPIRDAQEFIIKMAEKNQEDQLSSSHINERNLTHLEFWGKVIEKCKENNFYLFSELSPLKQNNIFSTIYGVKFLMVINIDLVRIELYISKNDKDENKRIFDELYQNKMAIESEFDDLVWERLEDKKACRIKKELQGVGLYDKEDWGKAIDFLVTQMPKFVEVFKPYIEKFKKG